MEPEIKPDAKLLLGKYMLGQLLGHGSYAKVYHARSIADDMDVAVKVIDKKKIASTTMEQRIKREVSIMGRLSHPNIVKLHEVMATKSKIYLVMEHAEGGELFSEISREGPLTEPVARRYFQQLVSALHYCHRNGVSHRDIKPQNLLLDHDGNLKVSDFGLSAVPEQLRNDLLHTACGTPAYAAPEVVRGEGYDGAKADAWSCGIILFVLLAGFLPFDEANIVTMYQKIYRREFEFPYWFSKSVRGVIARLLDPNPETRITIGTLMRLSWFKRSLQSIHDNQFNSSETSPKDAKFIPVKTAKIMNAFDIISLSSGLDLSRFFEGGKKRVKRFTSREPAEKILSRLVDVGVMLGFKAEKTKDIFLAKDQTILSVELLEVAPSLLMVEMKGVRNDRAELEELWWEDFKLQLEDLVFAWHSDDI